MSSESIKNDESKRNIFQEVLNSHGYPFQYRVLRLANDLSEENRSNWIFEAAEFPVEVQGYGTRIDFILRFQKDINLYLIAECKRANPALSDWFFVKSPYVVRNRTTHEPLLLEHIIYMGQDVFSSVGVKFFDLEDAYHIALEVKTDKKGDQQGKKEQIESAATQIIRGLNGMIQYFSQHREQMSVRFGPYFLPVIFTTAKLWVSNVDLRSADLESGNIDLQKTEVISKPWIFYQYHTSPGTKHEYVYHEPQVSLGSAMESEYIRTIAVVNSAGIEEFLCWSSNPDLYFP